MASLPDAIQVLQEMSHSDKISKVILAVQECIHDGLSPQKVDEAIQSFLNRYRPFPDQNFLKGPVPAAYAAIPIPAHIANTSSSLSYVHEIETAQHTLNAIAVAAATTATCPSASSFARGLPYHVSALAQTIEFLEAAKEARAGWMADRAKHRMLGVSSASASKAVGLRNDGQPVTLNRGDGLVQLDENEKKEHSDNNNNNKSTENQKVAIANASSAKKKTSTKKSATAPMKPIAASKPPATDNDPTTPAKGGRAFGSSRRQASGDMPSPYGTRVTRSRTSRRRSGSSSSNGGDNKKRKASVAAAGAPTRKLPRQEPAANEGTVEKDASLGDKEQDTVT